MTETLSQLEKERVQVVRDIAAAISLGIPATDRIFA